MSCNPLDESDHVVRYCAYASLDPDDGCPTQQSFTRRRQEKGLSVDWMEHHGPQQNRDSAVYKSQKALEKELNLGANAKLVVFNVGAIKGSVKGSIDDLGVYNIPTNVESHTELRSVNYDDSVVAFELNRLVVCENVYPIRRKPPPSVSQ